MPEQKQIKKGDYIVATLYSDGSPTDQFCVGMFDGMTKNGRYIVLDESGMSFRGNGFRRAEKISQYVGEKIISNISTIEKRDNSVWAWIRYFEMTYRKEQTHISQLRKFFKIGALSLEAAKELQDGNNQFVNDMLNLHKIALSELEKENPDIDVVYRLIDDMAVLAEQNKNNILNT